MMTQLRPAGVCRIAVIRPNHRLGNNLLLTPLLATLEEQFPGAEVELVTRGCASGDLFAGFPQVTAIHAMPRPHVLNLPRAMRIFGSLLGREYDLAIDPVVRSGGARLLLGALRARSRIGYVWGVAHRDRCLTHAVPTQDRPRHVALAAVHLLRASSGRPDGPTGDWLQLDLRLGAAERAAGRARLDRVLCSADGPGRRRVGVYASATGRKNYPPAWWRAVTAQLLTLVPDAELLEFVPHDGRPRLEGQLPTLYSTKLRELGAALAATSLVVSADGGVMHLASAAGARVLGLFKATDPAAYGPYGNGSAAVMAIDADPGAVAARIAGMLLPGATAETLAPRAGRGDAAHSGDPWGSGKAGPAHGAAAA